MPNFNNKYQLEGDELQVILEGLAWATVLAVVVMIALFQ